MSDLPTATEAAEAVKTVGGVAGMLALAKVVASSVAKWTEHRAAERRARAEAALVEEQADLENIKSLAATVRRLQDRVGVLETALEEERKARSQAERERDEARTGRHNAILDADRRLAEAAAAIERSAKERAQWERIAREQALAYEDLVRAVGSGFSNAAPADRMDELDTLPPPRG